MWNHGEGHNERNPSVSDDRRPERDTQRTFQPTAKDGVRRRKRLLSFLVYAQNQKNWQYARMDALDPPSLQNLKAQLDLNVAAILLWIHSKSVNITGIMEFPDENRAVNREPTMLSGFLFPWQVTTLMLEKTHDLILLFAP